VRLSVLVPAYNEAESLPALVASIKAAAAPLGDFEILVVDDGSRDDSAAVLERLADEHAELGILRLGRNYGKSAALAEGFRRCRGEVVVTMDADLQDDPAELPRLVAALDAGEGWDLVSGWKRARRDPVTKTVPSRLWNALVRRVSGLPLHDFNCGFKAYRRPVVASLRLYGEMHRYLPVLAAWDGWRVTELAVNHRPRRHGKSKYGGRRFLNGLFDLLTISFIARRGAAPLHFFGRIAVWLLGIGLAINLYFGVSWLATGALRVRPLLILGLILLVLGFQFASLGLLGELMIHLRGAGDEERRRIARERAPRVDGSGRGAREQ
jgi:glycosyltransferase involved in cell wall biosynthesis